jgi:TRAP-type C4-dicarboxylate transport system permease small subunit
MYLSKVVRFFDRILGFTAFLSGVLLMAITVFISWAVGMRYLNFNPPVWVIQYTEYALLWITFLGAAWLLREKGHIRIDTLISRIPPRIARWLELFNDMVGLAIAIVIFWFGSTNTLDLYSRGIMDVKAVTLPMYALFAIIPLGGLLLLLQFLRDFVDHLVGKKTDP